MNPNTYVVSFFLALSCFLGGIAFLEISSTTLGSALGIALIVAGIYITLTRIVLADSNRVSGRVTARR